jgi:glyceraldehyde-3-phosphate dehydrogenase/erythrose-4-phosphate dehydrogenase
MEITRYGLSVFLPLTTVDLTVKVSKETSYEEIMAVLKKV